MDCTFHVVKTKALINLAFSEKLSVFLFLSMQIVGFLTRRLIYYFDIKTIFLSNFPSTKLFILPCLMSILNIKL